ncbi:nucleotide exchange factor Fes1-domain-containing protein [Crassisporium funariophilum]|nr:nucleotide exchange factor Fes1-domain-containing protein [Crassisporium funariophilum]
MQSLLRWSIENSTPQDSAPSDRPPVERKDIDPGIIDMILGKPDAVLMKEDMAVAVDVTRSEDDRLHALDHLEMLIESIDNANDLERVKLWEPLQSLLTAEGSTSEIKTQAVWVIGTALQNNPSAQDVYLSYNPLPTLLSFLNPGALSSVSARAKAVYALSGLLKHNAPAVEALQNPEVDGWTKFRDTLQDPAISVRRKTIFLLSALLIPTSIPTTAPAPPNTLLIEDVQNAPSSDSTTTNILTPDTRPAPAPNADPIHANSHAAHLHNPSRTSTSELTLHAFREHNVLDAIISAITSPLPHGEDGENTEADVDFEEKALRLLYTYAVVCLAELSKAQKEILKNWIQSEKKKIGESQLLEKWGFTRQEYAAFVGKLL